MKRLSIIGFIALASSCSNANDNLENYLRETVTCESGSRSVVIAHERTCWTCLKKVVEETAQIPGVSYISDYRQMGTLLNLGIRENQIFFEEDKGRLRKLTSYGALVVYNCPSRKIESSVQITPSTLKECLAVIHSNQK